MKVLRGMLQSGGGTMDFSHDDLKVECKKSEFWEQNV